MRKPSDSALITGRKNPKVKIASGMASKMTTGLIIALAKPGRSADVRSDCLLKKEMPWNMKPATHSEFLQKLYILVGTCYLLSWRWHTSRSSCSEPPNKG